MNLTHLEVRLLEFEQAHPRNTGLKSDAIVHRLGMSPSRYYQQLRRLARTPAARERYPAVVARVERAQTRMRQTRDAYERLR